MKKSILTIALCCAATGLFAQNADLARLAEEGQAARDARNWREAYTKWSTYLEQTNYRDSVIAYNCGFCADMLGKFPEALKCFDVAIRKKYNMTEAYMGKARALLCMYPEKKDTLYVATLKEGIEAVPDNEELVKTLIGRYKASAGFALFGGLAGVDNAIGEFKKILTVKEDEVETIRNLGGFYYLKGTYSVKTDAEKAKSEFKEAKKYYDKLIPLLSPDDTTHVKWMDEAKEKLADIDKRLK